MSSSSEEGLRTQDPSTDRTNPAVAQVFETPELCEHILYEVGITPLDCSDNGTPQLMPATRLFPLLRVYRTFNAIIKGARKLRSLMFLSRRQHECSSKYDSDSVEAAPRLIHAPVLWMLSVLGVEENSYGHAIFQTPFAIKTTARSLFVTVDVNNVGARALEAIDLFEVKMSDASASWRSMPAKFSKSGQDLELNIDLWFRDEHSTTHCIGWRFPSVAQLGDVIDQYITLMKYIAKHEVARSGLDRLRVMEYNERLRELQDDLRYRYGSQQDRVAEELKEDALHIDGAATYERLPKVAIPRIDMNPA